MREPEGRTYALDRLLYGRWGVLTADELEASGSGVLRPFSVPPNPLLASREAVLAQLPDA